MSENKTILLRVELDTAKLKQGAEEASKRLTLLKAEQDKLKASTGMLTPEYAKLKVEIAQQTKILNDNSKALVNNDKLIKSSDGSINDLRAELAGATVAYNALTQAERENSEEGGKLQADIKSISDELKIAEGAIGDTRRNVGNYTKDLSGLKSELKDLKGELTQLDAGSEEYRKTSERAGELADKIKEVNENVRASTGGTGFEKLSSNLGLVQDDLMNLDFEGVAEKMSAMSDISKSMSFGEALGGLKNMGSALVSLGKSLLLNPLFLLVGVIGAVAGAFKMWSDSVEKHDIQVQENFTKALESQTIAITKQIRAIKDNGDLRLAIAKANGSSEDKIRRIQIEEADKLNNAESRKLEALDKERLRAKSEYHRNVAILNEWYGGQDEEDEANRQIKKAQETLLAKDAEYKELRYQKEKRNKEAILDDIAFNNDKIEKEREANKKIREEQQQAHEERINLHRKFTDLFLEGVDLSIDNEEKLINSKYNYLMEAEGVSATNLLDLQAQKNEALNALDIKHFNAEKARINENLKREIEDEKGHAEIIKQLKINRDLKINGLEEELANKQKVRADEELRSSKDLNAKILNDEIKTDRAIEVLDTEINLAKKKGTADEFSAWSNIQFAKIHQIEALRDIEINNAKLTAKEKEKIAKESDLAIQNISNETFENSKDNEEKLTELTKEQKKALAISTINIATSVMDTIFQIQQNQIQQELNEEENKFNEKAKFLDDSLQAGLITQNQYNLQKANLDADLKKKESKLKEEAFKKQKAQAIISATIATALAVTQALASSPPPASFILAGISAVAGAVQVGAIINQPTPTFARGGLAKSGTFGGNAHSNGGTKGVFSDGTRIEVEADENFYILNKKASRSIANLDGLNRSTGGVPLMERGGFMSFGAGGFLTNTASRSSQDRFDLQNQITDFIKLMPRPVVLVQDIISSADNLTDVVNRHDF